MYTTLQAIKEAKTLAGERWEQLLKALRKPRADYSTLPITALVGALGVSSALNHLSVTGLHKREVRLFAVGCARQAQHLLTDSRGSIALDAAEKYALGLATDRELAIAHADVRACLNEHVWGNKREYAQNNAMSAVLHATRSDAELRKIAFLAPWDALVATTWDLSLPPRTKRTAAYTAKVNAAWAEGLHYQEDLFRLICSMSEHEDLM